MTDNQVLDNFPADKKNVRQNKSTLITICVLLIVGLIGELTNTYYFHNAMFDTIVGIASSIGQLWGIILLIKDGPLLKTRPYFQLILFFFGITIIGSLFKIQHWPWAGIMLTIGLLGIATIYAIRFLKKQNKKRLDILKFLWVTVIYIGATLRIQHWPYGHELLILQSILLVILFVDFSYQHIQTNEKTE
ncbi:MAG: hypothetical protein IPJ79_20225 [Bacteroidetes bacterium]|nr:hypothetical protein [Bacteroidota bacterium]